MIKSFCLLIISVVLISCGPKAVSPIVDLESLEDLNYPCIKVGFLNQIRYDNLKIESNDNYFALIYHLSMSSYMVDIVKLYALVPGWSFQSLPELYDSMNKVYERTDPDNPKKSAIIALTRIGDDIYLKGVVGEFISKDRAVRVEIFRVVKKGDIYRQGVIKRWLASATGKRSIENMKKLVDYTFNNISNIECNIRGNIDMNWWKE